MNIWDIFCQITISQRTCNRLGQTIARWKAKTKYLMLKKIRWKKKSWRNFILKILIWWKSMVLEGGFDRPQQYKRWNLKSKLVQKVVYTCPLVLKLCEVAVPTSFTTSENFIKKYSFLVKLWTIFNFTPVVMYTDDSSSVYITTCECEIEVGLTKVANRKKNSRFTLCSLFTFLSRERSVGALVSCIGKLRSSSYD